jgi:hypothetical protein
MRNNFVWILSSSLIIIIALSFFLPRYNHMKNTDLDNACGCAPITTSGEIDVSEKVAYFDGDKINIPEYVFAKTFTNVLGIGNQEKWIEIDLSDQKLYAWEGSSLFLETKVSTGLPWTPTPIGEFRIWTKLRATKMEGGSGKYYYNLPNVPYVMFFENGQVPGYKGYGLHGTYWHSDFGTQRSHGCVNLPTPIAKELYFWTTPVLPDGKNLVRSTSDNPGTKIVIHQ